MTSSLSGNPYIAVARGARDYVRAIDLLNGAPLSPDDQSFRFRFNQIVRNGGSWQRVTPETDHQAIKVALAIQRGHHLENWGFVCDDHLGLVTAPDIQIEAPIELLSRSPNVVTVSLWPGVDFWEQLVETVRFGGDLLFPNRKWLMVGISGSGACLLPLDHPGTLTLELLSTRNHLNVIRFVTSDGRDGRVLTAPRPDHAR